jgi:hypothetical protein
MINSPNRMRTTQNVFMPTPLSPARKVVRRPNKRRYTHTEETQDTTRYSIAPGNWANEEALALKLSGRQKTPVISFTANVLEPRSKRGYNNLI